LEKVKKKLEETTSTIDDAAHRSRQLEKRLKKVEALPAAETEQLLDNAAMPEANGVLNDEPANN
jgi:DNA recombination protein RmuC